MEIRHEIIEELGTLSDSGNFTKAVKVISWNGAEPVIDIRSWDNETGRARKGITLKADEVQPLIEALTAYQQKGGSL